jgi:cullin-4
MQPPPAKRLKISHSVVNIGQEREMGKSIISRPGSVDLTRPSNFQPHTGAKRLVIKNLRTPSRHDVDEFYNRTWEQLDASLTSVFNQEQTSSPLEVLCRGVEATCRRGQSERLSTHLKERCKAYLEKQLLPVIERDSGSSNVDALRTVHKFWMVWNEQSVRLDAHRV